MEKDYRLYAITTEKLEGKALVEAVEQVLQGGATLLQYREKSSNQEKRRGEALALQAICKNHQVPFLINDDVALAREIDADGVHLGQQDMSAAEARKILGEDKIIGVTAKTVEQAKAAEREGANYLGSGAVFSTSTKADAKPMSHQLLDEICESVSIPVVAIGGIGKDNILELKGRKMQGFAIVGALFQGRDMKKNTEEMMDMVCKTLQG